MGLGERGALEARCFHCNKDYPWDAYEKAEKDETLVTCAGCGQEMALTPFRQGFLGYLCLCDNYVAIPFEDQIIHPQDVLKLTWNEDLRERGTRISESCSVAFWETDRDKVVLLMLQLIAKEANREFRFVNDENGALLAFDHTTGKYIGFLTYYDAEEYTILNQLFVLADHRRKGYASGIVSYWVENHASQIADKFAIEAPNAHAIALHMKLGHLREEGDNLIGVNCIMLGPGM
jgi:GNAT superfamily N-acetyltransferase